MRSPTLLAAGVLILTNIGMVISLARSFLEPAEQAAGSPTPAPRPQQFPNRILTTHVGSLPRPAWLVPIVKGDVDRSSVDDFEEKLLEATKSVMQKQLDVGVDFINDGELGRGDYVSSARKRLSGFDGMGKATGAADLEESTE